MPSRRSLIRLVPTVTVFAWCLMASTGRARKLIACPRQVNIALIILAAVPFWSGTTRPPAASPRARDWNLQSTLIGPGRRSAVIDGQVVVPGEAVGGARVSPRHANFIEAGEDASPEDVHALMELVRERVARETGVELRPEIRFVGFA